MSERAGAMVALLSGKGGVGKTNLAANLAVAAAGFGSRVLLVDGDLGLASVDSLLGLVPQVHLGDVLDGRCTLRDAVLEGPRRIHVLPAASGRGDLAAPAPERLLALAGKLRELASQYELTLVDLGAGVGPAVVGLAAACPRRILVTTPEPTSLVDAYAALKVVSREAGVRCADLVVNDVRRDREAIETHARLQRLARRFLELDLELLGALPRDRRLADAVAQQRCVVEAFPGSRSARRLVELTRKLMESQAGVSQRSVA